MSYTQEGRNKAGDLIQLIVDEEKAIFRVICTGDCIGMIFPFAHEGQAIIFYNAALESLEIEEA